MLRTITMQSIISRFITAVLIIGLVIAGLATQTAPIRAAGQTITINSLSDDQTVGGVCLSNPATVICLRNVIATANAASVPTTIKFSVSGTIYVGATLTINNAISRSRSTGQGNRLLLMAEIKLTFLFLLHRELYSIN